MNISRQEAWDILHKWQTESRTIWAIISYYNGGTEVGATLFGRIKALDREFIEMDARTVHEFNGNKTTLKVELKESAFDFSDWKEQPREIAGWSFTPEQLVTFAATPSRHSIGRPLNAPSRYPERKSSIRRGPLAMLLTGIVTS